MGIVFTVIVFGFIGLVLLWLMIRYRRMKLRRGNQEQRSRGKSPVVYEKKPGDGVEKKPLEPGKHE
jgi:hypothetical protein